MVPNGWQKVNLKSLLSTTIKNGYSPNAVEQETGYVVLGLGALTDNKLDARNIKNVEATEQVLKSQLSHGDFLISRSNTPDKVGRSCMFRGEVANCSYPDLMMKFRANEVFIEPVFLEIYLQSSRTRQYFQNCAAGSSSSMVKITKSVVEKAPVLLPPLLEQRKIAQILSTWDRGIATTEKLIDVSKQQKKALMQHLLTGKKRLIDPETGKAFEGEWEEVKLTELCKIGTGKKDANHGSSSGKYPFFTCAKRPILSSSYSYDFEALLIAGNGVIGTTHYYKGKFEAYQRTYILSEFRAVFVAYLHHWINFYLKRDVDREKQHGAMPYIKVGMLQNFKVKLGSYSEQQKIASVLTSADKEVELLEAKLAHFKQEKKALMQQLLTGKRRVKVAETEAA
ncbi:restriction endonuclease subunit S [Providencia rettgeri]|uniref:Restriction endonuclease subunit S n=1 Tax=Providencia huashanensis TaxID=3037798 RepID=A0ABT9AVX0_9GAMM|nr:MULTISPECIES: restriction endonuclease subunit S [Morganellaceae]EEO1466547.1 restriction endonuclease subunit S [Salmonella enterica subsp. enterica serovar Newport]EHZ7765399.1 restriction endonuclease subunit S [Providencia rettgeri]EIJ7168541.1 restriction endonuclease subunit S [Providencia rettgeri]ELR5093103.1 restriction endonuclease subunit S [Providencia rettgeri]MBQ0608774.1 restriction endonuclease subunit S [Providencia rettgeri]